MPSQAMRSAVKQITKLHESLTLVLPETQVEVNVFALCPVSRAIMKNYKNSLGRRSVENHGVERKRSRSSFATSSRSRFLAFSQSPNRSLHSYFYSFLTLYVNSSDVFLFLVHIQGHHKSFQGKSSTQVGQAGSDEWWRPTARVGVEFPAIFSFCLHFHTTISFVRSPLISSYRKRTAWHHIIIRNCRLVTSDLAFFKESLKNLNGIGDVGRSLDDLWRKVNELRMNRGSPSTGRKNVLQR